MAREAEGARSAGEAGAVPPAEIERRVAEVADLAWFEVDADRRIVRWSPGAARLTGFAPEEVEGLPCVVGVRCQACLGGCGVFEHGEVRAMPMVLHRKDGAPVPVTKSGAVLRGPDGTIRGAVEVMHTEQVEADDRGRACGALPTEVLLAALGREGLLLDGEFRVVDLSSGLAARLGATKAALAGRPAAELLGDSLFSEGSGFRAGLEAGERREGWRARLRLPGGAREAVSVSAGRVAGDVPRYFVMIRPEADHDADIPRFEGMVARSAAMQRIFRLIELLRDNDATVLITGESGTGKELVARALHARSHRARGPFVAVNCGALPPDLLESELFGHVRGAFTGAVRDRPGRFELAEGGTLFLDEVGDLPLHLQVKLLRVLQERTFERVGDARPRRVDVRIVAATNVDLLRAVAERRFRDDLYYRLRVVPIEIPPLRERREDLELLVRFLLRRIGRERGRSLRLSPSAMRRLLAYPWPGNVRELENALEYATAVCEGQTVHVDDLPAEIGRWGQEAPAPEARGAVGAWPERPRPAERLAEPSAPAPRSAEELAEIERIREALAATRYRRAEAARLLGMSRTTLWRKMKQYGL